MYDILNYVSGFIWGPFTLILILGTGIFLSLAAYWGVIIVGTFITFN